MMACSMTWPPPQGEAGKPGVPGRDGVPGKEGLPGLPGKQVVYIYVCIFHTSILCNSCIG